MVSGAEDPVGDYGRGVQKACDSLKKAGVKNITVKLYDNDRHELLNEEDGEQAADDAHRRRQAEGAGTGDDQYGHRGGERGRRAGAGAEPVAQRPGGQRDHHRHEDARDAVGQALHVGLARLRLFHEPGHLRQLRVVADARRAHDESSAGGAASTLRSAEPGAEGRW